MRLSKHAFVRAFILNIAEQRVTSGIVFSQTRVFPAYPALARRIYDFFCRVTHHKGSGALAAASFLQVAEKFMAIMSDERQTELYLKVCNSTPLDAAAERSFSRQTPEFTHGVLIWFPQIHLCLVGMHSATGNNHSIHLR